MAGPPSLASSMGKYADNSVADFAISLASYHFVPEPMSSHDVSSDQSGPACIRNSADTSKCNCPWVNKLPGPGGSGPLC